jgi:hypothetical protein
MNAIELLRWQWNGYARYHQHRVNLLLHIVAVPLFLAGTLLLVAALARGSVAEGLAALGCIAVSVVMQGRGHKMEPVPPEPFTGPANAVSRLVLEQWINFPRFVLSGGWLRALREAKEP